MKLTNSIKKIVWLLSKFLNWDTLSDFDFVLIFFLFSSYNFIYLFVYYLFMFFFTLDKTKVTRLYEQIIEISFFNLSVTA